MKRVLKAVALITVLAILAAMFCACDVVMNSDGPTRPGRNGKRSRGTSGQGGNVSSTQFTVRRVNADGTDNASGEYLLFGEYPQSRVWDDYIFSALGDYDPDTWTSYNYYIEGVASDYMQYTDKEYNGSKYRGVWFTSYRPDWCTAPSSEEKSWQDDNGYHPSTVYWFKYEPIKWRILSEADGKALILGETALDFQQFDFKGGSNYKNNYKESTIRKWLNETFYDTAFNSLQKELIQTTMVDNSVSSTGYDSNEWVCANTEDKIFLLSCAEATNAAYGLGTDAARVRENTNYAQSQGFYRSYWAWWLRSPYNDDGDYALDIDGDGSLLHSMNYTLKGIVPALTIKL